jgi:GrpB-like predicted nucleotidyltransferase (UPF0157 family)
MALTDEPIEASADRWPEHQEAPITLVDYDPFWPARHRHEEGRVRAALGERVRALEHGGSTAVPGLAARPCVDMLLALADSSLELEYLPALEAAGYRLRTREPEWYEHRLFKTPAGDVNLHLFSEAGPEIDRMVAFRDRLRSHPEERALL